MIRRSYVNASFNKVCVCSPVFMWVWMCVCTASCQVCVSPEYMKPWGQPRGSPPASVLTPTRARHTKTVPCSQAIKTHTEWEPTNLFKNHAWRYKQLQRDNLAWNAKILQNSSLSYKAAAFSSSLCFLNAISWDKINHLSQYDYDEAIFFFIAIFAITGRMLNSFTGFTGIKMIKFSATLIVWHQSKPCWQGHCFPRSCFFRQCLATSCVAQAFKTFCQRALYNMFQTIMF